MEQDLMLAWEQGTKEADEETKETSKEDNASKEKVDEYWDSYQQFLVNLA